MGKNEYHYYTTGLIVPLFACLSGHIIYKMIFPEKEHYKKPFRALFVGTIVGILCYLLISNVKFLNEDIKTVQAAVLCGLLSAEVLVFSGSERPSMAGITLWLFFYYHSVEHLKVLGEGGH